MSEEERRVGGTKLAWALALGATIPFLALSAAVVAAGPQSPWSALLLDGFKTWSAVVLSFLAGARWGIALRGNPVPPAPLILSVLVAVFGWLALLMSDRIALAALLLAYCAQGAWDSLSAQRGDMPAWYGPVRIVATLTIAAAHIAAFVAVY